MIIVKGLKHQDILPKPPKGIAGRSNVQHRIFNEGPEDVRRQKRQILNHDRLNKVSSDESLDEGFDDARKEQISGVIKVRTSNISLFKRRSLFLFEPFREAIP